MYRPITHLYHVYYVKSHNPLVITGQPSSVAQGYPTPIPFLNVTPFFPQHVWYISPMISNWLTIMQIRKNVEDRLLFRHANETYSYWECGDDKWYHNRTWHNLTSSMQVEFIQERFSALNMKTYKKLHPTECRAMWLHIHDWDTCSWHQSTKSSIGQSKDECQHWFRKWLGTEQATSHYLNQ